MADNDKDNGERKLLANDGTDWTTPPSPVDPEEKRQADKELDEQARKGDGPGATNEVR